MWIAVIILFVCMLLSVALFFIGTELQVIGIRNAVKAELANLSAEIADDTYKALREGNFEAYQARLNTDSNYKTYLIRKFNSNLGNNIKLSTESYDIGNINLTFSNDSNALRYTFTCDITFYMNIFGGALPNFNRYIVIEGCHNAKY